ncbi:MAG: hypothetical protein GXP25_13985 [Planctomycetes bacterium]|nr:hypothetical protein [Planctomycetota bacterium]
MIRETANPRFTVSAPGSICLFGEELAPLGLRTIHMAISMRVYLRAETIAEQIYRVEIPAENRVQEFAPMRQIGRRDLEDPLRRAIGLLKREGLEFARGCHFEFDTEIPPEVGLGYSAASMVAWVTALLRLHDKLADAPARRIAHLAYEAALNETRRVQMADYLASAAGGIHAIDHDESLDMTPIPRALDGIIIAQIETGEPQAPDIRRADETISQAEWRLRELDPSLDLCRIEPDRIMGLLQRLPDDLAVAAYAVAVDRNVTERAYHLLTQAAFDQDAFGELLDTHHEMLRDHLGIAVPQIDRLIEVSKLAGALGGKLNLPDGRTATLYAPGRTQTVLAALREAGARPHVVIKAHGMTFEGM